MAVIEVCDICRNEVYDGDGISVKCSDWNGLKLDYWGGIIHAERKYDVRICNKCKENIIKYCKENR